MFESKQTKKDTPCKKYNQSKADMAIVSDKIDFKSITKKI